MFFKRFMQIPIFRKQIQAALLFTIITGFGFPVQAQQIVLQEDFEDEDLTQNPEWTGDLDDFTFVEEDGNTLLRLNAPDAGSSQLSTASPTAYGTWEFFFDQDFPPSNNNRAFIFLISDRENLDGDVNGYAIRTGENSSPNFFRLFRFENGSTANEILTGELDISDGGPYQIKITRDEEGTWSLYESTGYGSLPEYVDDALDNTFTTPDFLGFDLTYTSSRNEHFFFDNIIIKDGIEPLTIYDVSLESGKSLRIFFTEPVDETTLHTSNFSVNGVGPQSASPDPSARHEVLLEFEGTFSEGNQTLVVNNVQDFRGNVIETGTEFDFFVENPFRITDVEIISKEQIDLTFSEEVAPSFADPIYFHLSGVGTPSLVEQDDPRTLSLIFTPELAVGEYDLTIEHIESISGWTLAGETSFGIFIFDDYEDGDLVITEFFYRTPVEWRTGEFDRPQYVEILNRSGRLLNLRDYTINGQLITPEQDLPIAPGEYLVITRGEPVFRDRFGDRNFFEADEFPTLNLTTSDEIVLETGAGVEVESLTYTASTWGGNGVALERLSTEVPASFRDNWVESEDVLLGSPGLPNTVSAPADPPEVTEVEVPLPHTLLVTFSGTLSAGSLDLNNFSISNGIALESVSYSGENERILEFEMQHHLEDQSTYTFSYQQIEDIFGNGVASTSSFDFTFINPFRILTAELEDARNLLVRFTHPLQVSTVQLSDFRLGDDTGPAEFGIVNSETVRLTFSEDFGVGEYLIVADNIESLTGWTLEENSASTFYRFDSFEQGDIVINEFMYRPPTGYARYVELHNSSGKLLNLKEWELRRAEGASNNGGVFSSVDLAIEPGGFIVLTPDTDALEEIFGNRPWFRMENYPGLTQTTGDHIRLLDSNGNLVDFLEYEPAVWGGNGVALERRSSGAETNSVNNWEESLDPLLGTPGRPNSVDPDEQGPRLIHAGFVDADTVRVAFSGALDTGAITAGNFSINGGLSVTEVHFINSSDAYLILNEEMTPGREYTLTAARISDIFGNVLEQAQASFTYYFIEIAEPGDVVINEFMYNEPEDYTRYIELYNTSSKAVDLAGWQQANNTGTRRVLTLERTILPPGAFIVILPNEELLNIFPDIPYLNAGSSLSALKNGGDDIVITNAEGTTLDSLRYSPVWGGHGVALERRRADLPAVDPENWGESPNERFGTPGRPNEISSRFDFTAESVQSLSPRLVRIAFTADVKASDAVRENFSVDGIRPASVALDTSFAVLLEFSDAHDSGEKTLTINNVHSTAGFRIPDNSQFNFTVYDEFREGDIVINEFMYRPPDDYVRYVELYNPSGKLLNLRGWRLQRRQISTESPRIISTDDLTIEPGGFVVLTEDSVAMAHIFGGRDYVELPNFPGFTVTTADQIRLFTHDGVLADSLQYSPATWGGNGVALERRSPGLPATLAENWGESPHELLGTPGLPNEVELVTEPPVLERAEPFENRGFLLTFNKRLEDESATDPDNYTIEPSLSISSVTIDQNVVTLLVADELVNNQVYQITVKYIADPFGNVLEPVTTSVHYLEFGEAVWQQIVINEILYRRRQAGSPEFVELFNRSHEHIDLSGWTLSDATGSATIPNGTALLENDYLVFADTESFAAESDKIIYMPNFRPLNNNGDAVVLKDSYGMVIDSLFYRAEWGQNPAGISLERKDPSALSIDPSNWAPSTADEGSTPVAENSRFGIDRSPPEVLFANLFHPDSLEVRFNKFVDLTNSHASHFRREEEGGSGQPPGNRQTRFMVNGAEAALLEYDPGAAHRIVLDVSGVTAGQEIVLDVEHINDFQGNINPQQEHPVAQPVREGDLMLNEIMFNPLADNRDGLPDQSEYIEIYNRRPYAISLEGIFLHDEPDENNRISRIDPVTSRSRWIPANGYALFYPEPQDVPFEESRTAVFFELPPEFEPFALRTDRTTLNLPNSGREVYLADSTLTTIDRVDYRPEWHNPNLADTRGIALERINPDFDSNDPSNWGSSTTLPGGTPGQENTLYQEPGAAPAGTGITFTPNPFSPDGDGFEDNLFINYSFDEPDYLLRIRIYDRYGRLVRNLTEGEPAGFQGSLIWDGHTDDGQRCRIGIYIVFVEATNSANGRNRAFRETVVVARQF